MADGFIKNNTIIAYADSFHPEYLFDCIRALLSKYLSFESIWIVTRNSKLCSFQVVATKLLRNFKHVHFGMMIVTVNEIEKVDTEQVKQMNLPKSIPTIICHVDEGFAYLDDDNSLVRPSDIEIGEMETVRDVKYMLGEVTDIDESCGDSATQDLAELMSTVTLKGKDR